MLVYRRETGAIIDYNGNILHLVEGDGGSVSFPFGLVWEFHRQRPGSVYALSHIHPPTMTELSPDMDEPMLKAFTMALDPWPIRLITITETGKPALSKNDCSFFETCYLGVLESKQSWLKRGKTSPRTFEIIPEWQRLNYNGVYTEYHRTPWYGRILLGKSYEEEKPETTG